MTDDTVANWLSFATLVLFCGALLFGADAIRSMM
jgi:hypothetical protein